MNALAIAVCIFAGAVIGTVWGYTLGSRNGRDEQWCDDYFARIERDRARRAKNGQFKSMRRDV